MSFEKRYDANCLLAMYQLGRDVGKLYVEYYTPWSKEGSRKDAEQLLKDLELVHEYCGIEFGRYTESVVFDIERRIHWGEKVRPGDLHRLEFGITTNLKKEEMETDNPAEILKINFKPGFTYVDGGKLV